MINLETLAYIANILAALAFAWAQHCWRRARKLEAELDAATKALHAANFWLVQIGPDVQAWCKVEKGAIPPRAIWGLPHPTRPAPEVPNVKPGPGYWRDGANINDDPTYPKPPAPSNPPKGKS